jgi:hypothetical protein
VKINKLSNVLLRISGSSPIYVIEYLLKASQGSGRKGRYRRKPCTVLVQGKHWRG